MKRRWIPGIAAVASATACAPVEADVAAVEPAAVENVAAADPDPEPSGPAGRGQGSLTVEVIPQFSSVLAGSSGHLDLLVRLTAAKAPDADRPPLDLALVLDRSGSMAGPKLEAVKQAALETLRKLEPDDRITLISYDDGVRSHASLGGTQVRRRLRWEILGLRDGGGTALGPALRTALDDLDQAQRDDEVLAHVMLLSDGLANEGESRPDVLAQWTTQALSRGVATSTLGVGLDYNEDLMTRIADAGGGRYHFIENEDQVVQVLADEFAGLTATVARNVTFEVEPAPGLEVGEVPGYVNVVDGDAIMAKVGSISGGRSRELLVRVDYPAQQGTSMDLGTYTLRFRDVLEGGAPKEIVLHPSVALTDDPKVVDASENYAVTVRAQEIDVAAALQTASESVNRGDYDEARGQLQKKGEVLRQQAAENPDVDFAPLLDDLEEAEKDLERAKGSMKERKRYQKKNKAKAYKKRKK